MINGDSRCNVANFNSANIYCALDTATGRVANACFGDSGGPLLYFDTSSNAWFVYGVVSFVIAPGGVCNNAAPSYYSSVPAYLNWLETSALTFIASGQTQPVFASSSQITYNGVLIIAFIFISLLKV